MTVSQDFRLRALAHHEAGHAVAALAVGWRIIRMWASLSDCDGHTTIERPDQHRWQHDALIAMAGPAAHHRFDPEELTQQTSRDVFTGEHDHARVRALLTANVSDEITDDEFDALFYAWKDCAFRFVWNQGVWAAVEAVAERFVESEWELLGPAIHTIVAPHLDDIRLSCSAQLNFAN